MNYSNPTLDSLGTSKRIFCKQVACPCLRQLCSCYLSPFFFPLGTFFLKKVQVVRFTCPGQELALKKILSKYERNRHLGNTSSWDKKPEFSLNCETTKQNETRNVLHT